MSCKWNVGYRTSHLGGYEFYFGADDLDMAISAAQSCLDRDAERQVVIFGHQAGCTWYYGTRRYIYGASDNDLYRRLYGRDLPISATAGGWINSLSSTEM